jgi:uncharacterized protein YjiS (DUF1127 family)
MDITNRALMNVSSLDLLNFFEGIGRWLREAVLRSIRTIRQWNRNQKTRKALLNMSNHMLKDIGLSRVDAMQEGKKAFWQY